MDHTRVTCPNCGGHFEIHVRATRGKCPHCSISLIYETVREPPVQETPRSVPEPAAVSPPAVQPQPSEPAPSEQPAAEASLEAVEEKVDITRIEHLVDAMDHERGAPRASISDIAVIESLDPDTGHQSIEKKVDRLLRSRTRAKG
ncbi:MAG: hypothetical protein PHU95_03625 [Candidatus Thermoplasmatota archaeon]|nr:hypothetical protein [Candidatus Thermoplasmatota archaeon]